MRAFNDDVRERRALRFGSAIPTEELDFLFGLSRFESLFRLDGVPLPYVDVFDDGHLKKLVDVQRKSGKSALAVISGHFRRGSTIRVRDLDKFDARLNSFVAEIERQFAARSQVNAYLTPPGKTGFPPHFDITDVFIVQCGGKKEWTLFQEYSNKSELPLTQTNWDPEFFKPTGEPERMTLNPGDVLYMPRGVMHQASCTDRESLHLTISLESLTIADLIVKGLKMVAETDVAFRRRVPWSFESDDQAAAVEVRTCLRKLAENLDAIAVLDRERSSYEGEPETSELRSTVASLVHTLGLKS